MWSWFHPDWQAFLCTWYYIQIYFIKKNAFSGGFIDNPLYGRSRFIGRSKGYHIPWIFTMLRLISFLEKSFWTGISFNVSHYLCIILPILCLFPVETKKIEFCLESCPLFFDYFKDYNSERQRAFVFRFECIFYTSMKNKFFMDVS